MLLEFPSEEFEIYPGDDMEKIRVLSRGVLIRRLLYETRQMITYTKIRGVELKKKKKIDTGDNGEIFDGIYV